MPEEWPTSLPQKPRRDGYQEDPGTSDIRSPMDVGVAKVRRRFTAPIRVFSWSFEMTTAQLATFETFWETIGLTQTFNFAGGDPRTGDARNYRLTDSPKFSSIGPDWIVSLKVEVVP